MQHIAIMRKSWGLTQKIASGQKTIESRWYMNRSTPWNRINKEDVVYFKDSGAPVTLKATVANVLQFDNLNSTRVYALLRQYGRQDGLTDENIPYYYELFRNKRYCLLIFLKDVRSMAPFHIDKRGYGTMASWITVPSIKELKVHSDYSHKSSE